MIVKTNAIVLKSMRYRETSKIVTFYTRRYGKLAAVAKGARETRSKFGAALEPMTSVALVLYKKDQRSLQFLSQCDILKPYKKIHSEMDRMSAGLGILELLNHLTHDEEENPALYVLVEDTLDALEGAPKGFRNFLYGFELRLSAVLGFAPRLEECLRCGRKIFQSEDAKRVTFQLDRGGMICSSCSDLLDTALLSARPLPASSGGEPGRPPAFVPVRMPTAGLMQRLLMARLESLSTLEYHASVGNELDETLRCYLRYHFEDLKPLKSSGVFEKIV